ncbi:MAG: hypothetical protein ACE5I2_15765, partial [Anaerolineae bacterium]
YDEEANRLDTVRYGREPEYKKKTLTEQLDAELASILAVRPDLELVALADGAEENWRYFDRPVYDNATKIVDHGHASQHLRAAIAAYYGDKSVEGRAEYERLRIMLRDQPGGADEVITARSRLARKMRGNRRQRLDVLTAQLAQGVLHPLDVRLHRHLAVIPFREDIRQPDHRRPTPTEPPLLPMAGDMPVQDLRQAHLDHLTDEQRAIVDPLGDDHQFTLPKALRGLLSQLNSHGVLSSIMMWPIRVDG